MKTEQQILQDLLLATINFNEKADRKKSAKSASINIIKNVVSVTIWNESKTPPEIISSMYSGYGSEYQDAYSKDKLSGLLNSLNSEIEKI